MIPIPAVFKGGRDYLHSTTVFDGILAAAGPDPRKIDFKFNRRTDRACALSAQKPPESSSIPVGIYHDSRQSFYVVETSEAIAARVPYDEDGLASGFRLDGETIRVPPGITNHSFIEAAVAAYKRLLIGLHGKERFAFVRLSLERIPAGGFEVRFERMLSGGFYQGNLTAGGETLGRIFFGKWQ